MVRIITEGCPDENQVLLDEITCKYVQEPDCTEDRYNDDWQELILSTRDGGGGKFINISTKSWSIGDNSDILPILEDFSKRMNEILKNESSNNS